jgi:hypothetical protein
MITDGTGVVPLYMADDAGALLVRSGLVPPTALDEARIRVANLGGTIGEQLVVTGAIGDDALTDFYRSRLLVPQVNPNTLARLPEQVVSTIPSDMAIELRAIPVALDRDNNLTVAMSDPSDSHAVDEIAFFTGTYVVRAVATQMQIAWCLAHYYGHVTPLGQRLLQPTGASAMPLPIAPALATATPVPRSRGDTERVVATRRRAIAPVTGPVDIVRPLSGELDLPKSEAAQEQAPATAVAASSQPRTRSVSGEIRVPVRRAPSIKPAMPAPHGDDEDDDSGPVITLEAGEPEEATGPRKLPPRRKQKQNPPELAARAGEIAAPASSERERLPDADEPRIIITDEPPPPDVSGELQVAARADAPLAAAPSIEIDDTSVGVVIHDHPPPRDDSDEIVVLEAPKRAPRREKRTQVGIGALPAMTRSHRDTEASGPGDDDETRVDTRAAPPSAFDATDETLAPPPEPSLDENTSPHVAAPPRPGSIPPIDGRRQRPADEDDEDGDSRVTAVMTAAELDAAIPLRDADVVPGHLVRPQRGEPARTIDHDPLDDGWGPPGTTIPPPLLGAIPGSEDDAGGPGRIPMPDVEAVPLIVAPPAPPEPARGSPQVATGNQSLVRALEDATSRSIELIHLLERAQSRDEVVHLMIGHLTETHRRAGFFSITSGELRPFAMLPKPEVLAVTALRLDRPSTLQDVVGTRLPYRGPMHDDASRNFLAAVLGASPPEILLVPVTVRERVVGVLFGEHRLRHTFDDQLALAGRAAGMALERILKARPRA